MFRLQNKHCGSRVDAVVTQDLHTVFILACLVDIADAHFLAASNVTFREDDCTAVEVVVGL